MLVDSHAHLDDRAFGADLEAVIARARENGVERIVTIGTDLASSRRAQAIAEAHEHVWFSPGIHPHEADNPGPVDELRPLAAHPRPEPSGRSAPAWPRPCPSRSCARGC